MDTGVDELTLIYPDLPCSLPFGKLTNPTLFKTGPGSTEMDFSLVCFMYPTLLSDLLVDEWVD